MLSSCDTCGPQLGRSWLSKSCSSRLSAGWCSQHALQQKQREQHQPQELISESTPEPKVVFLLTELQLWRQWRIKMWVVVYEAIRAGLPESWSYHDCHQPNILKHRLCACWQSHPLPLEYFPRPTATRGWEGQRETELMEKGKQKHTGKAFGICQR